MRYQLIAAETLTQLEQMVNTELRHDWQVIGGPFAFSAVRAATDAVVVPQLHTFFAQAMIKPVPQPK